MIENIDKSQRKKRTMSARIVSPVVVVKCPFRIFKSLRFGNTPSLCTRSNLAQIIVCFLECKKSSLEANVACVLNETREEEVDSTHQE